MKSKDRRLRGPFIAALALLLNSAGFSIAAGRPDAAPIVLENDQIRLECDPAFGRFIRIRDKASGIELAPAAGSAENFRLLLLWPDGKTAEILGRDQKLTAANHGDGRLSLRWAGPLKDAAGADRRIAVRMDITAAGNALTFGLHLENGTDAKVREVLYPKIGGLRNFGPPGRSADGVLWAPTSNPWIAPIDAALGSPHFAYPGQLCMSFTCIQSRSAGKTLYFASHDAIARYKDYLFDEPGGGGEKELFACIRHHPFTPPGKSFEGSPVVLRVLDGDWRAGGKIYRAWFERTFGIDKPAGNWIRRESFFLITMFGLPEGTINLRFKDIPRWAREAKDHGVNSVMISGWQHGGHDNGYPDYTPDPRLGTWKELEDGIKACHALGQKVYFFANYEVVMIDSEWTKRELHKYFDRGPKGELLWNVGWGMGTLWARMDHPKRMTQADPAFPAFRKILVDQFEKLASIGADGLHIDKLYPDALDYNPAIPMSPDTATWEGAIILTREIYAACRRHKPDWAMSFECAWDRPLQFSGATWWSGNQDITRQVFPENVQAQCVEAAYDYLGVNNLVRDGHAVMIAPREFSGGMGWKPWEGLSDYIKEVKRIRDGLQDIVFLGEVLGPADAGIVGKMIPGIESNLFRSLASGRRAAIFTNARMQDVSVAFRGFDGVGAGDIRIHTPFREVRTVTPPAEVVLPAEGIVFLEETGAGAVKIPTGPEVKPRAPAESAAPGPLRLEDDRFLVEVSRANGALRRILDKKSGLELIREPRLADNFRFTLPLPGKEPLDTIEANAITGKDQGLSSFEAAPRRLTLRWDKPMTSVLGATHDAGAVMRIELTEDGILFGLSIDNGTPFPVGEVFFPLIGGIQGFGKDLLQLKSTELVRPAGGEAVSRTDIFRVFTNMSMFGDQGPEQFYAYPKEGETWVELASPSLGRSVYFGAHDPARRPVTLHLELIPGNAATAREDGNWPRPNELKGLPVGVSASYVDFANAPAHAIYEAPPVLLSFHDGDWKEGRKIFLKGRTPPPGDGKR